MKCKRLEYRCGLATPGVLLGIIECEDSFFVYFKTRKRSYTIAKSQILSIIDTQVDFAGEVSLK